jgi:ComF family protein
MGWLHGMGGLLARLVAPWRCAACDADVPHGRVFCPPCALTLVRADNPDPSRIAAFVYGGAIAEALRRFKFDDRPDLAGSLVVGLVPHLREWKVGDSIVVPVPLHPSRLIERGYNQAALLARLVAQRLRLPYAPRALWRPRRTARQTDIDHVARRANVAGAFAVAEAARLSGHGVVLVDDVETTGSTLLACREALRVAGVLEVRSVVVARAGEGSGA